ncbi:hypothetical protein WR25_07493 [Diploscapter pachys]|uniref:Uncharacterized protein n=1 Tax=Diploscapter pachys TaxID=2018661 RepID=A0A2A2JK43_9BILA|nr:hypothetical protein WR25_07493 [Diploscapter pachys]
MPSMSSSSSLSVLPSLTVMTPFVPTFFIASEIRLPIKMRYSLTFLLIFFNSLTITSTAAITPRLISIAFAPLLMFSKPSLAMALASTVAQVVPSPASSFALLATS